MKVHNKRAGTAPEDAVYVGRPSKFGNPFAIGRDGSRDEVVAKYRAWLMASPDLLKAAQRELSGKDLVCWCAPAACHADVLLEVANAEEAQKKYKCEWNPLEGAPAEGEVGCQNQATFSVGPKRDNLLLCAECAALPRFSHHTKRPLRK